MDVPGDTSGDAMITARLDALGRGLAVYNVLSWQACQVSTDLKGWNATT